MKDLQASIRSRSKRHQCPFPYPDVLLTRSGRRGHLRPADLCCAAVPARRGRIGRTADPPLPPSRQASVSAQLVARGLPPEAAARAEAALAAEDFLGWPQLADVTDEEMMGMGLKMAARRAVVKAQQVQTICIAQDIAEKLVPRVITSIQIHMCTYTDLLREPERECEEGMCLVFAYADLWYTTCTHWQLPGMDRRARAEQNIAHVCDH